MEGNLVYLLFFLTHIKLSVVNLQHCNSAMNPDYNQISEARH